jgi:stage V sporulation protein R
MKATYTADDLNELDERCQVIASELGLSLPPTLFELVQPDDMYDIAARGLPGRYSHYQFGRSYDQQKRAYDQGRGRIYELVINTKPVQAYLLDGNSLVAQLLVIAHVYGHGVMYEHNAYFKPADKNILSRVKSGADRIDGYIARYGRTEVENFIDAAESLQWHSFWDQLGKRRQVQEPEFKPKQFDELFPEDVADRRAKVAKEKVLWRTTFPRNPERDILGFIEQNAPHLEDWQKDVISIIRTERDYFTPQTRCKVLHEGVASFYHNHIVQKLMGEDDRFTTDDFTEFQHMNAMVLHPKISNVDGHDDDGDPIKMVNCDDYNPYLLGSVILEFIDHLCIDPTDKEKEKWSWAGQRDPQDQRNEVIQSYDDISLLSEFITPWVCEKAKVFMEPRTLEKYRKLRVTEEEAEQVAKVLSKRAMTRNMPVIEVVNGDGRNRGELWLEHRWDPENPVGLDEEYAHGTVSHMANLWGRAVVVHSCITPDDEVEEQASSLGLTVRAPEDGPEDVWIYAEPGSEASTHTSMDF